jgi:hypothetical protein
MQDNTHQELARTESEAGAQSDAPSSVASDTPHADMRPIVTWNDAFLALEQRAHELRGSVEIHLGTPEAARWPRTTGADVVVMASIFDPTMCGLAARLGDYDIGGRWRAATDDIVRFALSAPRELYRENQAFWTTLAAVAVYLDSIRIPVPTQPAWDTVLAKLGDAIGQLRNAGPRSARDRTRG